MFYIFLILAIACAAYVVFSLIVGATRMAKSGDEARQQSNDWMWKRVAGQAGAVVFLLLAFWIRRNGG